MTRGIIASLLMCTGIMAAGADLQPGTKAPDFSALDQGGKPVKLANYLGKSNVVLYFYPKDFTPGCTKEACTLRDGFHDIQAAGAVVLGVSADDVSSHAKFAEKYDLPFSILADPDDKIIEAYGVKMPVLKMASRVTFIIDKAGIIRFKVDQVDTGKHDQQVLELLKKIS